MVEGTDFHLTISQSNSFPWAALATFLSAVVLAVTLIYETSQRNLENNIKTFLEALDRYNNFIDQHAVYRYHTVDKTKKEEPLWVKGDKSLKILLYEEEYLGKNYEQIKKDNPSIPTLFYKLQTCLYLLNDIDNCFINLIDKILRKEKVKKKYEKLLKGSITYEQQMLLFLEYEFQRQIKQDSKKSFLFTEIHNKNLTKDIVYPEEKEYLMFILNKPKANKFDTLLTCLILWLVNKHSPMFMKYLIKEK